MLKAILNTLSDENKEKIRIMLNNEHMKKTNTGVYTISIGGSQFMGGCCDVRTLNAFGKEYDRLEKLAKKLNKDHDAGIQSIEVSFTEE